MTIRTKIPTESLSTDGRKYYIGIYTKNSVRHSSFHEEGTVKLFGFRFIKFKHESMYHRTMFYQIAPNDMTPPYSNLAPGQLKTQAFLFESYEKMISQTLANPIKIHMSHYKFYTIESTHFNGY